MPQKIVAQGEKDVLRGLIDRQLLLEKGKDLGITADTELIKRLDEMRKQMKLDTMEDLEKAATAQGVSFEDFKQNMRTEIITQQVIQREVGSHINISKEEEQSFTKSTSGTGAAGGSEAQRDSGFHRAGWRRSSQKSLPLKPKRTTC